MYKFVTVAIFLVLMTGCVTRVGSHAPDMSVPNERHGEECIYYFMFFSWGEATVDQAMKNANITRLHKSEMVQELYPFFGSACMVAYGS